MVWLNSAMTSVFSPIHHLEAEDVRRPSRPPICENWGGRRPLRLGEGGSGPFSMRRDWALRPSLVGWRQS